MADDFTNSDDNCPEEPHMHAIPAPAGLLEALTGQTARMEMRAYDRETTIWHLLDSLTTEQVVWLRKVLNLDVESASNNYVDGQCVAILRAKGLDPWTGEDPTTALQEGQAT